MNLQIAIASIIFTLSATLFTGAAADHCAAENILQACLTSMKPQLENCAQNDWKCLCVQSNNVLTCYNNCPTSPSRSSATQRKESYCNAAKAAGVDFSSPSSSLPSSTSTSTAAATANGSGAENGGSRSSNGAAQREGEESSESDLKSGAAGVGGVAGVGAEVGLGMMVWVYFFA